MLQAVIVHRVNNPKMHYIKRVDIGLNGQEVATLRFMKQDNNNTQTISYEIPNVKTGDTLSVEAYCSISGILKREIKAEEKPLLNK
jgi:desulfoferrodoxin (superoxide reductase-like protein)